jgi:two-component system sensor histidine kinase VicK
VSGQNVRVRRLRLPSAERFLGMRWWLGLMFAAVAALTAVVVVAVLNARSERSFRRYAETFAVGRGVMAAEALKHDATVAALRRTASVLSQRREIRLYAFAANGRLLTPAVSRGVPWSAVPDRQAARAAALSGMRYIHGSREGAYYVVAVPIRRGAAAAVVTFSRDRGLRAALGIIQDEFLRAALVALAAGAALGLLIATLIARRLRRIAVAATAIGAGDLETAVADRFPDEVGKLALAIERMRGRLQVLFATLEHDRDRLEHVFERLDDGVLVVNRELGIEFANARARTLVQVNGHLEDGDLRRLAADLFRTGIPESIHLVRGERRLEVSGIQPAEGGESAILVVHDETQKERNERVQREFATNAAHELRTPLATIAATVEALEEGAKDDPAVRDEFLKVIRRETARLARLTRALLVLARAGAGDELPRRRRVSVAPLIESVAAGLAPRNGVRVDVDCPDALAIDGDPDLLEQALSSIATNAMQHTAEGSVTLRGRAENGSVVIEVTDTGSGIPEGERQRIFDRFYRVGGRSGGFGLGLPIANEAVGALGGRIDLDSEVGRGTTVRITLERARGGS